jgi:probable F420-dependent oxidoreductase
MAIGPIGVWSRGLRYSSDRGAAREAAVELETLGYAAIWLPDVGGDVLGAATELLAATNTITVATGVLNIWFQQAAEVAARTVQLERRFPGRFLLGLGASHAAVVPDRYAKPLSNMSSYLDALDAAPQPVPVRRRVLAALGPRMLALSRDRAAGAHPYLVPPEHTRMARGALGDDRLLAVEQSVHLGADVLNERARARAFVADYMRLPNYVNNLRRLGYADEDFLPSDRLAQSLVAVGDEQAVAGRVRAHLEAGADHVCIQVIDAGDELPLDQWRRLAPALNGLTTGSR